MLYDYIELVKSYLPPASNTFLESLRVAKLETLNKVVVVVVTK